MKKSLRFFVTLSFSVIAGISALSFIIVSTPITPASSTVKTALSPMIDLEGS